MTLLGLDVHARQTHAATLALDTGELRGCRLRMAPEEVVSFLAGLPGPVLAVYEAGVADEAFRDLIRCIEDLRGDLMRARHRLSKFLLRRGHRYQDGDAWTPTVRVFLAVFTVPFQYMGGMLSSGPAGVAEAPELLSRALVVVDEVIEFERVDLT